MIGKHRVLIPNVKTKQCQLVILGGEQWAKFENDYNGKPVQQTDETLAIRVYFLGRELWTKPSVIDMFSSVLRYKLRIDWWTVIKEEWNLKRLDLKIRFIRNKITKNNKVQYISLASLLHYYKEASFLN